MSLSVAAEEKSSYFLIVVLLASFFFPMIALDWGFSLAPSMVLLPVLLVAHPRHFKSLETFEKFFLLFAVSCCISHFGSVDYQASFRMLLGFAIFFGSYFLFRDYFIDFFNVNAFLTFGWIYCLYCLATYLFAVVLFFSHPIDHEFLIGILYDRGLFRMAGPVGSPNYLGLFLFPIFFAFWSYREKMIRGAWLVPLSCLLLTFSLSSYLSAGVAIVFGKILLDIRRNSMSLKKGIIVVSVALLMLVTVIVLQENVEFLPGGLKYRIMSMKTGSGRYYMWEYYLQNIPPEIRGIGLNNLQVLTKRVFNITNIHNTYLEILMEQGYLGLFSYILFVISLAWTCFKMAVNKENTWPLLSVIAATVNIYFVSSTITPCLLALYLLVIANNQKVKNLSLSSIVSTKPF